MFCAGTTFLSVVDSEVLLLVQLSLLAVYGPMLVEFTLWYALASFFWLSSYCCAKAPIFRYELMPFFCELPWVSTRKLESPKCWFFELLR